MFFLKTGDLFSARNAVIWWTQWAVWPFEIMYDAIENELERRGHKVKQSL
jgi:hypothetical protein